MNDEPQDTNYSDSSVKVIINNEPQVQQYLNLREKELDARYIYLKLRERELNIQYECLEKLKENMKFQEKDLKERKGTYRIISIALMVMIVTMVHNCYRHDLTAEKELEKKELTKSVPNKHKTAKVVKFFERQR